jgi:hypothetical protein
MEDMLMMRKSGDRHATDKLRGVVLLLMCLLAMSDTSQARSDPAVWANLSGLHAGQLIQVTQTNSQKHRGAFVAVTAAAIRLQEGTGEVSVPKQDVLNVKLANDRRLRNTLIGLGIGAGVGAGVTAAAWESHGFVGSKGTGALIGAAIGGLTGAIVGAVLPGHKTIYNAQVH